MAHANKKSKLWRRLNEGWQFAGSDGELIFFRRDPEAIGVDEVGIFYFFAGRRIGGMCWDSITMRAIDAGVLRFRTYLGEYSGVEVAL